MCACMMLMDSRRSTFEQAYELLACKATISDQQSASEERSAKLRFLIIDTMQDELYQHS